MHKSATIFSLLLLAPFVFAFPSEFYNEPIDRWLGNSCFFNETIIQPLNDNETYKFSFSLIHLASHVQVQIYDEDGNPEHNIHFYYVSSGGGTIELGDKGNLHICRIQVWGFSKYDYSAGEWSVFRISPE